MYHLFRTAFFFLITVVAFAQNSAVTNAILYHRDGDLAKAKQEIDQASTNEKTKDQAKTWAYKGIIYQDIANSAKPEVKALDGNALTVAYESYLKAQQLDPAKGEFHKLSTDKLNELWAVFINKGLQEYEANAFKSAIKSFESAQAIKPTDSTAFVYGIYAADELKDNALIKKYCEGLKAFNYKSTYVYYSHIMAVKNLGNMNEAIAIADKAVADFPSSALLVETQTNLYLEAGKHQEAVSNIEKLLKGRPNDLALITQLAVLYDHLKQTDKAAEHYEKVLAKDPANFICNFNSAVIYYDKGRKENDLVHSMGVAEYQKNGKAMEAEVQLLFKKALDHAEKALKAATDASDKETLETLIKELHKVVKK